MEKDKETTKTLAIHLAEKCAENQPDAVCLLITACAKDPVSINAYYVSSNGRRETPLHICARIDAWVCAKHLLDSGVCDLLLWNDEGKTALRVARDNKCLRMIEVLENFPLNRLGVQGGVYNQLIDTPPLAPLPHSFWLRPTEVKEVKEDKEASGSAVNKTAHTPPDTEGTPA
jgi:hypothetical protein